MASLKLLVVLVFSLLSAAGAGNAEPLTRDVSTDTVYQAGCQPRPPVKVQSSKIGEKDFQVTVTAGSGNLQLIRFGNAAGARLDLPGHGTNLAPPQEVKPSGTTYQFTLHSTSIGGTVTVPITVFDGCGMNYPWNTFVGAGTAATKVQMSIADTSVVEGDSGTKAATFTVTLGSPASAPVTVAWTTNVSASAGSADFVAASGVLTFTPGQTSKTIDVQVIGNTLDQPNRTFTVTLSNATNATILDGTATATIIDNEGAPSLSIDDKSIVEGDSGTQQLQFTVSLSSPSGQQVSVQYATANDTAVAPSDYTATNGTVTFDPGQTSKPVTVQVVGDQTTEPNERFFVNLSSPVNASISKAQGIGTITDNDPTPEVTLSVTGSPFAENGGTATVKASLNHPTSLPVTVDLDFGGGAIKGPGDGTDYTASATQISIPALGTEGTITLTGLPDTLFEGNESVDVAIVGVTNAVEATPQIVTATITEDDTAPTVALSLTGSPFNEEGGQATVTATRTGSTSLPIVVTFGFNPAPGTDYDTSATQVTIPAASNSASITLTGKSDTIGEGAENVTVSIQSLSVGTAGSPNQVTASITDDDGPTVTTTTGSTAFSEGGAAVVVDNGLLVTTAGPNIASATVKISNLLDGNKEALAAPASGPFLPGDISYDSGTGTLTITRSATAAQYQAFLRTVTYVNTSDAPNTTTRAITFQVSDGTFQSNVATRNVTLGAVNDAPQLSALEGTTVAYTENGAAIQLSATIDVADLDSANLASAKVQITTGCLSGEDVLALSPNPQNGITGAYTAASCTLDLTGSASLTAYRDALRAVLYSNTSNNPSTTNRTVSFTVNDGSANSNTLTRNIGVSTVNDAPTVTTSAGATAFAEGGGAVVVDGSVTVTDPDDTTLVSATVAITNVLNVGLESLDVDLTGLTGISKSGGGTATLTLTETSAGSASLADMQAALQRVKYNNSSAAPNVTDRVVSFKVNDGDVDSNTANKTVSITAVNSAPVVDTSAGTSAFVENGGAVVVDSAVSVSDADNSTLASAVVAITNVQDTGLESLDVDLSSPTVLSGIAKSGGGTATLTLTQTSPGSASLADMQAALQRVKYNNTSDNPNTATDRVVSFKVNDGTVDSNVDTKSVSVAAANDAPVVTTSSGSTSYTEGPTPVTVDGSVTATDVDNLNFASATISVVGGGVSGDTLAVDLTGLSGISIDGTSTATNLKLTGSAPTATYQTALQRVTFTSTSNNPTNATRTVRFVVNDGTVNSNNGDKQVTVIPQDDAPVITLSGSTPAFTENGSPAVLDNALTVIDSDSPNLVSATVTLTNRPDGVAEVLAATGSGGVTVGAYNPTTGELPLSGSASPTAYQTVLRTVTYSNSSNSPNTTARVVSFVVNDGTSNSNVPTVNVTVVPGNDPPVITLSGGSPSFTEGGAAVTVDGSLGITDPDDTNLESATVKIQTNCTSGEDQLLVTLQAGITSTGYVPATCTLPLSGSAPIATYVQVLQSVQYNNTNNANPSTLNRTVRFVVNDGTSDSNNADQTVTVNGVNDAPTVTAGGTLSYTENDPAKAIDATITVNDVDSANLTGATIQITGNCANPEDVLSYATALGISQQSYTAATCTLVLTGTTTPANYQTALRNVKYNNTSENPSGLARTVTWIVTDGALSSATGITSTINVTAVNDPPNDADESFAAQANVGLIVAAPGLLSGATDVDGGTPAIDASSVGTFATTAGGSITIAADGSFSYTPQPGDTSVADTFVYTVTDGQGAGGTNTSTVTFNVDANAIWFVDLAAGTNGNGTLSSPFNSLASLDNGGPDAGVRAALDNGGPDASGQTIFIYTSDSSAGSLALTDDFDLQQNQFLIGEGVTSGTPATDTINTIRGFTTHPNSRPLPLVNGARPTITSSTTDALTLASGNTLRGFNVGNSGTGSKIFGTSFGTLTVGEVSLSGTGQALNLTTGTLTGSFTAVSSTSSTTNNIKLNAVASSPGAFDLGSGALSGATGAAFQLGDGGTTANAGGTAALTYSGTIAAGTGRAVDIQDRPASAGNVTLSGAITGAAGQTTIFMDSNAAGTYTFSGAVAASSSTATAINLTSNTGATINFTNDLDITTTSGSGFVATGGGTVSVQGSGNTINAGTGQAINLNGVTVPAAGVTFATTNSGGGTHNVELTSVGGTGAINLGGGALSATSAGATNHAFLVSGGSNNVTYTGSITKGNQGDVVNIASKSGGTVALSGNISGDGSTGISVSSNTGGTIVNFSGSAKDLNTGANTAVDLTSNGASGGATINFTGGNLDIDTTTGIGFNATGGGTIGVSGGSNSITSSSGKALHLDAVTPTVTFATLSSTNSSSQGVSLTNLPASSSLNVTTSTTVTNPSGSGANGIGINIDTVGGSSTLSFGNTSVTGSANTGVFIDSSSGAVTFGDLDITPDSGVRALHATSNTGTITATSGTINAPSATAIEIVGPADNNRTPLSVALTTVSSDGGTAAGIVLKNTNGSFSIAGTGSAGTGGTIANKTGADITASSGDTLYNGGTTGAGVIMQNAGGVSLDRMQLNNFTNFAIYGTNVGGFTLANSTLNHTSGKNGDNASADEGTLRFQELSGTATITNSIISDGLEDTARIVNKTATGTLNSSGSTFSDANIIGLAMVAGVSGADNGSITANITTPTFTNNGARHLLAAANSAGSVNVNVGTAGTPGSGGSWTGMPAAMLDIAHNGSGTSTFNMRHGTFTVSAPGQSVPINIFSGSANSGTLKGTVANNTVTGADNTGFPGIQVTGQGISGGITTVAILNNTVTQIGLYGIWVSGAQASPPGQSSVMNSTIQGNSVTTTASALQAIRVEGSVSSSATGTTACADIGGTGAQRNTASAPAASDIFVTIRFNTTMRLPGYTGGSTDDVAVETYLSGRNIITDVNATHSDPATFANTSPAGSACAQP